MKLWVHVSILKTALSVADAAEKKNDDDGTNKKSLKKVDSICSNNSSSYDGDGLSRRKEQWVWVLSEVISGYTQDLFSPGSNANLTAARTAGADATLIIRVVDNESEYADKVINIDRIHINLADGGRGVLPANMFENEQSLPSDLTQLTHLHEPAVLDCLHRRYQLPSGWEMYTSSGPILIAINPCRMVKALYDESTMKMYQRHGEQLANGSVNNNSNNKVSSASCPPPHVFAVADSAYRGMMRGLDFARNNDTFAEKKKEVSILSNQSILVSGESGAGKTVTTKFLMQYLADLSRKVHSDHHALAATTNNHNGKSSIEQRVLNSNPILEAFGNARTLRNDNSSRFGKFIEMRFSDRGRLLGAYIDTYLLEKARIVGHTCGEQTYHIFYEVLAKGSLSETMRRELMIENTSAADFAITTSASGQNNSKLCHNDYDDHCKMFLELRSAMDTLNFSQSEQMEIVVVVCALLHLSNLTLKDGFVDVNDGEECKLNVNNVSLKSALSLLGVTYNALNSAVTTVQFKAVDELVTKNLSTSQAIQSVQALIKGVYDSVFTILVGRINSSIAGVSAHSPDSGGAFIGLLDIFGFETFLKNVFEQFCINYCNESLQQQFNRFVFKLEQQEYIREGIRWDMIEFQDNQDTLDLIEKKHEGILTILDEQCRLGMRCNDKTFVAAVYSKCMNGNTRFGADRKQKSEGKFTIRHYAGVVEYSTEGFMEKNKDEIPMEASELLSQSAFAFVRDIAEVISAKTSGNQNESKSSISRLSVGKQFSGQLQKLRKRIDETHPHYVRCIKPNEQLEPNHFDSNIVVDQLRCGGILEAIRVSRAGFPQRYTFEHFVTRFSILSLALSDKAQPPSKLGKLNLGANRISSKKKQVSKTQADLTDECKVLAKLISKWILKDRENAADDEPEERSSNSPSPRSFWKNKTVGNAFTNENIDLSDAGIQVGATKVFLIQDTFDAIERLRGQVMMDNATKINSIIRMYLARKAFIILLQEYRQARAQRRLLFEAHPPCADTKKCTELDENMFGKINISVDGYEIISFGERAKRTNYEPTDFMWLSVGHGRFVKKGEAGEVDLLTECHSSGPLLGETPPSSFQHHADEQEETSTQSVEQHSKPDSSVSQLVLNLQGEKKGKLLAPISPMSFWSSQRSSQASPRAYSDGNMIEVGKKASVVSKTEKINNNIFDQPQNVEADVTSTIKKSSNTYLSMPFQVSQKSPRAYSDGNMIEVQKETTVVSKTEKINNNTFNKPQSIEADVTSTMKKSSNTHLSRSFQGSKISPRAYSDGNKIEVQIETTFASRPNKMNNTYTFNKPQSIEADVTLTTTKNTNSNTSNWKVPTSSNSKRYDQPSSGIRVNSSSAPRIEMGTHVVQEINPLSEARPKAGATSNIKATTKTNKPSSSFAAFDHHTWQKPVSSRVEERNHSHPKPQPSSSNHFDSNVHHQKDGSITAAQMSNGTTNSSREERQDSSSQHSFNVFNEPSWTEHQFNAFQKASSTQVEEKLSPVSFSSRSGHQNVNVAARRRAKAINSVTMIDNLTESYKNMQQPIRAVTKPTAPAIAPPPLSSSAKARRNMKQKMRSNLGSGSLSESRSGSFSDYADF